MVHFFRNDLKILPVDLKLNYNFLNKYQASSDSGVWIINICVYPLNLYKEGRILVTDT